jgi:hypothetical protein
MRRHSHFVLVPVGAVLAAVAVAAPVGAHHGWSEYQDDQFEITGALETPVSLAGPHGTAAIRVGQHVWDLVFAPSTRTARAGLEEGVVPVGDQVTASGHRHRDAQTLEIKVERLTWKETVFDVYPDRN